MLDDPEQTAQPAGTSESPPATEQTAASSTEESTPPEIEIPDVLPVLATGPNVLYPSTVIPFVSRDERDVRAVDEAVANGAVACWRRSPRH